MSLRFFESSHKCTTPILILSEGMAVKVTKQLRRNIGHLTTRDVEAINLFFTFKF